MYRTFSKGISSNVVRSSRKLAIYFRNSQGNTVKSWRIIKRSIVAELPASPLPSSLSPLLSFCSSIRTVQRIDFLLTILNSRCGLESFPYAHRLHSFRSLFEEEEMEEINLTRPITDSVNENARRAFQHRFSLVQYLWKR